MTIEDLKIEPEFRDLIPKLTDAEFAQLEKNILEDGRVKEPIVVWNGIIIDGHHRYYILKDHPEIPYEIEQKEFANEYAAMAWACANQLGRRNLSDKNRMYLMGKQAEEETLAIGANQYTIESLPEARVSSNEKYGTSGKIAKEYGVGHSHIDDAKNFAKGIDIAEQVVPGIKDDILHGKIDAPKSIVQKIPKASPDKQRKAVIAISDNDFDAAKEILGIQKTPVISIAGLHDANEDIEYTIDDLVNEIRANFRQYMSNIKSTLSDHADVLHQPDCKDMIVFDLTRMFNNEIEKVKEI